MLQCPCRANVFFVVALALSAQATIKMSRILKSVLADLLCRVGLLKIVICPTRQASGKATYVNLVSVDVDRLAKQHLSNKREKCKWPVTRLFTLLGVMLEKLNGLYPKK